MVGAALACQAIFQRLLPVLLDDLLQLGLIVGKGAALAGLLCLARDEAQHKGARGLDAAVQVDCAEEGLHRIGQDGRALPAAALLLAVAETDLLVDAKFLGDFIQRMLTHHRRAQLGQLALREVGELVVEIVGRDKAEYGIAEELEPFIVLQMAHALFIGVRRVGHRLAEQGRVAEPVADSFL